jgi:phosphoglycerate dehydrogenase-like enzyme
VLGQGSVPGSVPNVFPEEPLPQDHPLRGTVIITPHISGVIILKDIAKVFIRFEEGKKLEGG